MYAEVNEDTYLKIKAIAAANGLSTSRLMLKLVNRLLETVDNTDKKNV